MGLFLSVKALHILKNKLLPEKFFAPEDPDLPESANIEDFVDDDKETGGSQSDKYFFQSPVTEYPGSFLLLQYLPDSRYSSLQGYINIL